MHEYEHDNFVCKGASILLRIQGVKVRWCIWKYYMSPEMSVVNICVTPVSYNFECHVIFVNKILVIDSLVTNYVSLKRLLIPHS